MGHVQGLVLGLGWRLFDVPLHGSFLDLGIGALPFLAAMLALGLMVSSLARTQLQATQMSFFFFLPFGAGALALAMLAFRKRLG